MTELMEDVIVNNARYCIVPIIDLFTWNHQILFGGNQWSFGVISECDSSAAPQPCEGSALSRHGWVWLGLDYYRSNNVI